jgi:hypothetical protein
MTARNPKSCNTPFYITRLVVLMVVYLCYCLLRYETWNSRVDTKVSEEFSTIIFRVKPHIHL